MKSIPVLGIPHYNRPDLLARCIASIDFPVDQLVIVQNGPAAEMVVFGDREILCREKVAPELRETGRYPRLIKQATLQQNCVREVRILQHPNAGVAASWNEIIQLFPASWWMIANNDIQFAPGDLEKMARAVQTNLEQTPPQGLTIGEEAAWREVNPIVAKWFGNHGASWFAITDYGIERVGLFDENFYPAYLEDCDWHYRAKLAGVVTSNVPEVQAVHGDGELTGSCTVNSDRELQIRNVQTHSRNFGYYEYKWGGRNGAEKHQHPYGEENLPVWAWKYFPRFRGEQQW
jgi:GT2 family glycosyltransferase